MSCHESIDEIGRRGQIRAIVFLYDGRICYHGTIRQLDVEDDLVLTRCSKKLVCSRHVGFVKRFKKL
jgi:hypothetical protein